jgi:hypothetical protein
MRFQVEFVFLKTYLIKKSLNQLNNQYKLIKFLKIYYRVNIIKRDNYLSNLQ